MKFKTDFSSNSNESYEMYHVYTILEAYKTTMMVIRIAQYSKEIHK